MLRCLLPALVLASLLTATAPAAVTVRLEEGGRGPRGRHRASRGTFTIRVLVRGVRRLRGVAVRLDDRTLVSGRGPRLTARVPLDRRPGFAQLEIVAASRDGGRVVRSIELNTCRPPAGGPVD